MNENEFLKYVFRPLTDEELTLLYRANNICYERCDLYSDFLQTIMDLIKTTYLGDDVIKTKEEKESHFIWCYNKVIDNFKLENINFTKTSDLYEFLYTYSFDFFYNEKDKEILNDKNVKYWQHIFKYSAIKTKSELDTMVDIYKILEKSLFLPEKKEN